MCVHAVKAVRFFQLMPGYVYVHVCVDLTASGGIISLCCLRLLLRSHLELRLSFLSNSWHFFPFHCPSDFHHLFSISVSLSLSFPLTVFSHSLFFDPLPSYRTVTAQPNLVPVNLWDASVLIAVLFTTAKKCFKSHIFCQTLAFKCNVWWYLVSQNSPPEVCILSECPCVLSNKHCSQTK